MAQTTPRGWRFHAVPLGLLILGAAAVVVAYQVNSPRVWVEFDSQNPFGTPTYLGAANDIANGQLISAGRLPGYPILLVALGATTGFYTLVALVQAVMFLGTVALTYGAAWLIFERRWIAFAAALAVATDIYIALYYKEILSESLATILIAALIFLCVRLARAPRVSTLWFIALVAVVTIFTRSEWLFLPIALAVYFFVFFYRRRSAAFLLHHAVGALVACYGLVGLYVVGNVAVNGYAGLSEINNVSLLGKVMEYKMELGAPARYQAEARAVDLFVTHHLNVWDVVIYDREFAGNHYELAGRFSTSVILAHPLQFVRMSVITGLTQTVAVDHRLLHVDGGGPLAAVLSGLTSFDAWRYCVYWLLPGFAAAGALLPLMGRQTRSFDTIGPVALLAAYGTVVIAFGGFDEYGRYHAVFASATNIAVWGYGLFSLSLIRWPSLRIRLAVVALLAFEVLGISVLILDSVAHKAAALNVVLLAALVFLLWKTVYRLPAAVVSSSATGLAAARSATISSAPSSQN